MSCDGHQTCNGRRILELGKEYKGVKVVPKRIIGKPTPRWNDDVGKDKLTIVMAGGQGSFWAVVSMKKKTIYICIYNYSSKPDLLISEDTTKLSKVKRRRKQFYNLFNI